jgi:hypothetical protein
MNKLGKMLLIIMLLVGQYSFSENIENKMQEENIISSRYLAVENVDNEGLVLRLNDGSEWNIKYFGGVWKKLLGKGWIEQKIVNMLSKSILEGKISPHSHINLLVSNKEIVYEVEAKTKKQEPKKSMAKR